MGKKVHTAFGKESLPDLVKGLEKANKSKPKKDRPQLFKGQFLTKGDIRTARVELMRAVANDIVDPNGNPFVDGHDTMSLGQAQLCAQLLSEIERALPDGETSKRTRHDDEHEWAKNIWNEAMDEAIKVVDRRRGEELPGFKGKRLNEGFAGVVNGRFLEMSADLERMKKRVE